MGREGGGRVPSDILGTESRLRGGQATAAAFYYLVHKTLCGAAEHSCTFKFFIEVLSGERNHPHYWRTGSNLLRYTCRPTNQRAAASSLLDATFFLIKKSGEIFSNVLPSMSGPASTLTLWLALEDTGHGLGRNYIPDDIKMMSSTLRKYYGSDLGGLGH